MSESTRAYLYRIVVVAVPLLVALGYVRGEVAPLLVALAGAVFSTGLAASNTSTKKADPPCVDCDADAPHGQNPELIDKGEIR